MGRTLRKWGLTIASAAVVGVAAVGVLGAAATAAQARETSPATDSAMATVRLSDLPVEARRTDSLIRAGGPFPYAKDGTVFGNRERLLPRQPRGHYREYTVPTPGSRDRGARRIVCGGKQPREPEACYYTQDHYASFRRIVP
ncbi:ribonuclease domain-containing protein [Ideonella alba]